MKAGRDTLFRLAVLALAAGCAGPAAEDGPAASVGEAAGAACPPVVVVPEARELVRYAPGPGRAAADVEGRAVIGEVAGTCRHAPGQVTVALELQILAQQGPAAPSPITQYDYFVAVAGPGRQILAKQIFTADLAFPTDADTAGTVEQLEPVIPLADPAQAAGYEILVGLQLTPEQLDDNRRAAASP